ncbi:Deoxyribodipyrimidine photo-lyase [Nymphon striatum]|nr:Deoxyribodipyrimidine photo-lyase [Nymphon striatum]
MSKDEVKTPEQDISVFWNRCYEPSTRNLLFEPWEVLKQDGTPYKVFTPYWNLMQKELVIENPLSLDRSIKAPQQFPKYLSIDELKLLPSKQSPSLKLKWDKSMISYWKVGELAASNRLDEFLDQSVYDYKKSRDFPAIEAENPKNDFGVGHLLREVAWREFAYSLLFHFPQTIDQPLNKKFEGFEWKENYQDHLKRWQTGMTGFPIIDAGMRELWNTGWMHNRVRMIVASFLTKNLLIPWQEGEAWFRDTLVDADLASNIMGWQWVAGSGADAAPYFRIFNPILQSKKFGNISVVGYLN